MPNQKIGTLGYKRTNHSSTIVIDVFVRNVGKLKELFEHNNVLITTQIRRNKEIDDQVKAN